MNKHNENEILFASLFLLFFMLFLTTLITFTKSENQLQEYICTETCKTTKEYKECKSQNFENVIKNLNIKNCSI